MNKRLIAAVSFIFCTLLTLSIMLACSDDSSKSSTSSDKSENSDKAKEEVKLPKIGEMVKAEKFEFTITTVTTSTKVGSEYLDEKAPEGALFLILNYKSKNITDEEQQRILEQFIAENKLRIRKFNDLEDEAILKIFSNTPGISYPDATVYFASKDMGALLLTGDKKLRTIAESTGVDVKGIFWAFDEMKTKKALTVAEYKRKLEKLKEINRRLPMEEFEKRK